ncbi:class C sortase [Trueperella pyogenes]|uniref:class C sortase n=1 Tax=Trueperella pyogenes TaxID=1661 RepID=UPI003253B6F7
MKLRSLLVVLTMLIAAAIVSIAPIAQHLYNDSATHATAASYVQAHSRPSIAEPHPSLTAAHAYNKGLPAKLLQDPWGENQHNSGTDYDHYLSLMADTPTMATLTIPALDAHLPIVHGTSDEALLNGVGHFYGSHLPVGGPGTHAVLAGHHTWPGHTYFSHLENLKEGDRIHINAYGENLTYGVVETHLVHPDDLTKIQPQAGRDLLTLVTCITPEGGQLNEYRLLVTAERIDDAGAAPSATPHVPSIHVQAWMYPRIITAGIALTLALGFTAIWISRKNQRSAKQSKESA